MAPVISKKEKIFICSVALVMALPLVWLQGLRGLTHYADAAFLYQITDNLAQRGSPMTQVNASTNTAMPLWQMTAAEIAKKPLTRPVPLEINQFERHSYLFMYALAPFTFLLPAHIVIPAATACGFVLLLVMIYIMLRNRGISIPGSVLFCLLLSCHPNWSQGLFGQPYADRFFLPLGGLFLLVFSRPQARNIHILLTGLLACMVIERTGLILSLFLVGYTLLYWPRLHGRRKPYLIMGFFFFTFSIFVISFLLNNQDNSKFLESLFDPTDLVERFTSAKFLGAFWIFFLFNFVFLGIYFFADWRLLMLAGGVMAPNIIVGIGGAELTGWSTHYHSQYFPFVAWAGAMGFIKLWSIMTTRKQRWVLYSTTILLTSLCLLVDPHLVPGRLKRLSLDNYQNHALVRTATTLFNYLRFGEYSFLGSKRRQLQHMQAVIPENTVVTTVEPFFPCLYRSREIHYYPIGIDQADFAILRPIPRKSGGFHFAGFSTNRGAEETKKANLFLNNRLATAGFELDNPLLVGNYAVLFRPTHQPLLPPVKKTISFGDIAQFSVYWGSSARDKTCTLNRDPQFISMDTTSALVEFTTGPQPTNHYAGIKVDGVESNDFMFDLWLVTDNMPAVMFVHVLDRDGNVIAIYTRNQISVPLVTGKKQTLSFAKGFSTSGFTRVSHTKTGEPYSLGLLFDFRSEDCPIKVYLDNLRVF